MSDRASLLTDFIARSPFAGARREPLKGDASSRRYERLHLNGRTAILLDQPPGETAACPPGATPAERIALGYNAQARLAGPDVRPFAGAARYLRARGFSAPEILHADMANGLLLLEDLGDDLYARVIDRGVAPAPLYEAAIDLLADLHRAAAPDALDTPEGWRAPLLTYDETALLAETQLLLDWYWPATFGAPPSDDLRAEFAALWRAALAPAVAGSRVFVLRDYHAENLLWLPERAGLKRVGLLDFQDGLAGSRAYDLISLTEDARRDVDPDLAEAMTARYIVRAQETDSAFDAAQFRLQAAVLAAQRNVKIIGIFTRLWKRDGKPHYPRMHPRLWHYMDRDLAHPELRALKDWFDRRIPADARLTAMRLAGG